MNFFDERLTINDSTSLIVLIREPQTQFARELNARIYSDTNFIKQLKESWYVEVEIKENATGRTYHKCGHDMYFYKLSGNDFTFLNQLNSNCQAFDIGSGNLRVLSEFGKPLHIDTLTKIRFNAYRDDLFKGDLFLKNRTQKMTLMKVLPILVFIPTLFSCGTTKEISTIENANYTIENLNIVENGFEGNIVVEVYDSQMDPINDYQSILTENGKVIFDVPQKGNRCTFFEDGKSVTIEIKKEGYRSVKTKPFSTDDEMELASFIKITLVKE